MKDLRRLSQYSEHYLKKCNADSYERFKKIINTQTPSPKI